MVIGKAPLDDPQRRPLPLLCADERALVLSEKPLGGFEILGGVSAAYSEDRLSHIAPLE